MTPAGMEGAVNLPPVVFAHGWSGSYTRTWKDSSLERTLEAEGRRLIRIDLPGHGPGLQSREPEQYTEIGEAFLHMFSDEPVVDGVGFSLGGKLLLELAARYPARFRRLVILGVGSNLFRAENGMLVSQALFATNEAEIPAVLKGIIAEARASGNDLHALSAVIRRPPKLLQKEDLQKITASVLLLAGCDDMLIGDPHELEMSIPGSQLITLDGLDHLGTALSSDFQKAAANFLIA